MAGLDEWTAHSLPRGKNVLWPCLFFQAPSHVLKYSQHTTMKRVNVASKVGDSNRVHYISFDVIFCACDKGYMMAWRGTRPYTRTLTSVLKSSANPKIVKALPVKRWYDQLGNIFSPRKNVKIWSTLFVPVVKQMAPRVCSRHAHRISPLPFLWHLTCSPLDKFNRLTEAIDGRIISPHYRRINQEERIRSLA